MLWLLLPRLINQTVSLLDSAHNNFTFSSYFLQAHGWETSFKNLNSDFWVIPWFHQLEFTKEADEYPEACNISKHKTRLYLIEHTSKHIWYQERACSVGGSGYWEKFQENKMTWRERKNWNARSHPCIILKGHFLQQTPEKTGSCAMESSYFTLPLNY